MSSEVILDPGIGRNRAYVVNRTGGGCGPVIPGDPGFGPTVVGTVHPWTIRRAIGHEQPQRDVMDRSRHAAYGKADIAVLIGGAKINVESSGCAIICVGVTLSNHRIGLSAQGDAT